MHDFEIRTAGELARAVEALGFLPLLKNRVAGFSVEEHTPPELWFQKDVDGPWEWKGPVIRETGCAYGKFFGGKAGFVSAAWFADFANYRRDGYDFDALYDDGLARVGDKRVYDVLLAHPTLLSKAWRRLAGMRNRGEFDAIVTRLQMQGYVTTVDFEYARDRFGAPYGWGLARYATPEAHFGADFTDRVYACEPEESAERIRAHLRRILPDAGEREIDRILG